MSSKPRHSQNGSHLHALSPPSSSHSHSPSPSTPSRRSTSSVLPLYTSSPSNPSSPMYPSPSRPHPFGEDDAGIEQLARSLKNSAQFGVSSVWARRGASVPTPTASEVANGRVSFENVNLEQHMQQSDIGRDQAMQSFIMERFLPAAKVVATDHDHTPYPARKHHPMNPSMATDMSTHRSAERAARLYSISSTFSSSKGVTRSPPLSQDEDEVESLYEDEPKKSSGFFCMGLKTAISRAHKAVYPSVFSPLRNKGRTAAPCGSAASYEEEEDVLPKVNISMQGMQRRRSFDMRGSYAYSSGSPTLETDHRGRDSTYIPSSRNGLARSRRVGQDGSLLARRSSFDEISLRNVSSCCHPISPSVRQRGCSYFKQSSLQGNAWQGALRPACDQACANCHGEVTENSPGGTWLEDYHLQNANRCAAGDISVGISANRASSEGILPEHIALEGASRDPDFAEDDENEFYDALDSWSPTPDNVMPSTRPASSESAKVLESSRKWASDEIGVAESWNVTETPHFPTLSCKTSGGHANHTDTTHFPAEKPYGEGATADSAYTASVKQKQGTPHAHQFEESFPPTMSSFFPLRSSSASPKFDPQCQRSTLNGQKRCSKPGWPLGISGFQSSAEKGCLQECEEQDDRCSTNSASVFTESNVSSPRVPLSPSGTWLERAMALNASTPSALATLQQKEKAALARKKLELTLSNTRKCVKWEDVVKGSQMHPEHVSASEERRHGHPVTRKAIKGLRL